MLKFTIIIIGTIFLSILGFIQLYVYAQIKLKITIFITILTNIVFIVIAILKL